jgi:hypothetical protein
MTIEAFQSLARFRLGLFKLLGAALVDVDVCVALGQDTFLIVPVDKALPCYRITLSIAEDPR